MIIDGLSLLNKYKQCRRYKRSFKDLTASIIGLLLCSDDRYFSVTVESDGDDPTLIQNLITSLLDSAKMDDDNHQRELNNIPQNSELMTLTP